MRIIIPMAGRGTRLRPHTLTVPKPLVPIAGKPIVQRLVEGLTASIEEKVEEIAFIIGDFGSETEQELIALAERLGAKGSVYQQHEKLGTAHAILCAKESLKGNVIVAFADTLFQADFKLDTNHDGVIWVQKVDDPSAFGVVKLDNEGTITDFVEKPKEHVSDLAIIGIYYFNDGEYLRDEMQYLIDNDLREKGEFQITNALENMKKKGAKFKTGQIKEWLDFGNKDAVVYSHQRVLEHIKEENLIAESSVLKNSIIIEPCFIDEGVVLENSIVGPHVSIGCNTTLKNCVISNSVVMGDTSISNAVIENSMIGNSVELSAKTAELSIGDYSKQVL